MNGCEHEWVEADDVRQIKGLIYERCRLCGAYSKRDKLLQRRQSRNDRTFLSERTVKLYRQAYRGLVRGKALNAKHGSEDERFARAASAEKDKTIVVKRESLAEVRKTQQRALSIEGNVYDAAWMANSRNGRR